jgi:hypothetical protein
VVRLRQLGRLGEGDAERLGAHGGGSRVLVRILLALLLDLILAGLIAAEWRLQHKDC